MMSTVSPDRRRFFVIWSFVMPVLMAIPVSLGFLFPQQRMVAMVAAIVVTLVVGLICYGATITRLLSKWVLGVLLVFSVVPFMLGSAEVGPNLALEKAGEPVEVRVIDVQREERRSGDDTSVTYTYSFERLDGGPNPGTIVYRGDGGYDGVHEGSMTTLLVDPTGHLEPQLLSEVDSSSSLGMLVFGVVATGVTWGIGCLTYGPRARRMNY
ncbi:MAG: hypothetical protein E7L00_00110 [Propionibacteriaceae bacterium]|nr:hypothetical protein [Propionibacteriaceae bacterium]